MSHLNASVALVVLILLPTIAIVAPVRADIGSWQVWTDKTVYSIGETITIHIQPTPMIGVALWLVIWKPDGSQITTDWLRQGQAIVAIPAGPPAGQYRVELWGQAVYPEATPELAANCYLGYGRACPI